jgi:hypothetical protein
MAVKRKTKPRINHSATCCKCKGRGYYKFQNEWWCDPCFSSYENVTSREYLAYERHAACYGQPSAYDPQLLATGGPRLTDAEKKRMTGI